MKRLACLLVMALGSNLLHARAEDEEKVPLEKLPKAVRQAVEKRFPKVEITGASKEKEGDKLVFEVSLKKNGKNIDVTLTETGVITLIEQELDFADLPEAVAKAFDEKYPKAKYEIVESVTKAADGKETLEYYEATLIDGAKKRWEVEVLPSGKIKSATEVKDGK
ncbi:MAG: PepSY-like domain-containing protein [Gemmataceae bacterium]